MPKKLKMICFDLDGTLADLYNVPNWLEKLRVYDASPYLVAKPLCDMEQLAFLLEVAQHRGIEIRVITWLSKVTTDDYDEMVRIAKKAWIKAYNMPIDHFHGVAHGATKADSVRKYLKGEDTAILFDDNAKVRSGWHLGDTYDPATCDICEVLKNILDL
jgi:FMN phosphatase YigB (HAD superfamily)